MLASASAGSPALDIEGQFFSVIRETSASA